MNHSHEVDVREVGMGRVMVEETDSLREVAN